jgi:hypothetical protein
MSDVTCGCAITSWSSFRRQLWCTSITCLVRIQGSIRARRGERVQLTSESCRIGNERVVEPRPKGVNNVTRVVLETKRACALSAIIPLVFTLLPYDRPDVLSAVQYYGAVCPRQF